MEKTYTTEEKAEYMRKQAEEMQDIFKRIDKGVEEVFNSDKYKEYLKFVSKFTDYSARNTMLINLQRPDATLVGSYGLWKKLGRNVNRGENGIMIMSPVPHKTNQYVEIERQAEDEWGNKLYNDDGTEKMETVEKNLVEMRFKKQYVFDLSQTNGKPIPEPVQELSGEVDEEKIKVVFKALQKVTGISPEYRDISGGAKGYYSPSAKSIVIKSGMSGEQSLKTVIHESAHCLLHDPNKKIVTVRSPRNEKEVQAESVAFIVCEKLGIDTLEYSFPYIASWSEGKQLEQLNKFLDEIQQASRSIYAQIDSELLKYKKRDLTVSEIMEDTELSNVQKAEMYIDIVTQNGIVFEDTDIEKIMELAEKTEDIGEIFRTIDDTANTIDQRSSYGYDFQYMYPLDTAEQALWLYDRGENVYLLYPDGTEGMAESREEIENFSGLFGVEKEPQTIAVSNDDPDLYPVSRSEAVEMFGRGLDVFVDGKTVISIEEIENAPDTARICLSEFQYSAELDLDKGGYMGNVRNKQFYDNYDRENSPKQSDHQRSNNIIGNTPYDQLGSRSELQYYTKLKNRHADNIAKKLDEYGVPFSGLRKGYVTTITINKADILRYESAVEEVKQMYRQNSMANTEQTDRSRSNYQPSYSDRGRMENARPFTGDFDSISRQNGSVPDDLYNVLSDMPQVSNAAIDYSSVPIVTESYMDAKMNGRLPQFQASIKASQACRSYIEKNIHSSYEVRNFDGFVQDIVDKFGIERAMYTVAATIQLKLHDGRFTKEVKEAAGRYYFDSEKARLNFLTETHPVMLNTLYEYLIEKRLHLQREQAVVEEKTKLPEFYKDKYLNSIEKVSVTDDYRGIPQTKYYQSSADEYFVEGIGWLDNDSYDREQKESGFDAAEFYKKITKVRAHYIDTSGKPGSIDMTRTVYELMTDKTYDPENEDEFKRCKAAYERRLAAAGVSKLSTEYYGVRQNSSNKYAVVGIAADGIVTVVKDNIPSVVEAKQALLDVYDQRKTKAHVELAHPQTIDEISAKMYDPTQGFLKYQYRIEKCDDQPDSTHMLTKYTLNEENGSYSQTGILCYGDYFECNEALKQKIAVPEIMTAEKGVQTFEIYQLKNTDETRSMRFIGIESLAEQGKKPDISTYEKVYEGDFTEFEQKSDSISRQLEAVYTKFNIDRPDDFKGHSLSISDVVVANGKPYYVDTFSFKELKEFGNYAEKERKKAEERSKRSAPKNTKR